MSSPIITVPARTHVDPSPATGEVLLIHVDEDLDTTVVRLTPENAVKLGQTLINVVNRMRPTP